jgi:hypothetical protein
MTEEGPLPEDIGEALVGDVEPERLEGLRFAQRIPPTDVSLMDERYSQGHDVIDRPEHPDDPATPESKHVVLAGPRLERPRRWR